MIALAIATIFLGILVLLYAMNRERRAGQLKTEFVANVSHELKTPLSLIRMYAELLTMGRVRDPQRQGEYHDIILRESERLGSLIENLLDFSRLERGRVPVAPTRQPLAPVLRRAAEIFGHRLEPDRAPLSVEVGEDLPALAIDDEALTLAILNLLDNAAKYGPAGGVIRLSAGREDSEVRVTVADEGSLLRPDELRRIFERFYRGEAATKARVRGSGIGLALVRSIAEAHGGRAEVESSRERGTRFSIVLPLPKEARGRLPEEGAAVVGTAQT